MISIFPTPWNTAIPLFKCGSASSILCFVPSVSEMISEFLRCELSWQHHFLWTNSILFISTTFLLYAAMFPFTRFLWLHISSLSNGSSVSISAVSFFFWNSTYAWFAFYFQHYHFISLPHFLFCWPMPSFNCPLCRLPCGYITGGWRGNTATCTAVCEGHVHWSRGDESDGH